jgi:pyrroline-5-carboxylate reductase
MNRRKLTPVESNASLERMINKFMQQGLSPETARKLAMERMYA